MKTTCAMVIDTLVRLKNHLHQAHEMQPDFHITMTHECKRDLLDDPQIRDYISLDITAEETPTIAGYGFSVVEGQEQPYRIWMAGKVR